MKFFKYLILLLVAFSSCIFAAGSDESLKTIIAIDIGTTYSRVSVVIDRKVEIIANNQGKHAIPSYVAWTPDGQRLVGDAAKNQAMVNPNNTIYDIQRFLGRKFSDKSVQSDINLVPFKVISRYDDRPYAQVAIAGIIYEYSPEEIVAMIMSELKNTAEAYLGYEVKNAVITVPNHYSDAQRQAMKDAVMISGMNMERIINEPMAISLAYELDKMTYNDEIILIYNVGETTLEVSLLSYDEGIGEVMASSYDDLMTHDTYIYDDHIKHHPSDDIKAEHDDYDIMTSSLYDELFYKALNIVHSMMVDVNMSIDEVDEIIIVGSSSHIPIISSSISSFHGKQPLYINIHPNDVISYGAAIKADMISAYYHNREFEKQVTLCCDLLPISYGIETAGGMMMKMIYRNTFTPYKKSYIMTTYHDYQTEVMIQVYEGERVMTKDNHILGSFHLTGISPAPRGAPKINISFIIDVYDNLHVSAYDTGTGSSSNISIIAEVGRLSFDDIDDIRRDADAHKDDDHMMKMRMESCLYDEMSIIHDHDCDIVVEPRAMMVFIDDDVDDHHAEL